MQAPASNVITLPDSGVLLESNVALAPYTSFRVGGPADWLTQPHTLDQLQEVYQWALDQKMPITFLGAGSNLLISDHGLPGLVMITKHLKAHSIDPNTGLMIAEAGKTIPRLSTQAAQQGCSGFEWAVGIPGTIGGAVVMNAGAHGGCVADNLEEVHILTGDGNIQILSNSQLHYHYRSSILQTHPQLVVKAVFRLHPGHDPQSVLQQTQAHRDHRLTTQPYDWPSCGSVFRNPQPQSAGWLIEQSGLKGYQLGGAQISEKHANFILNLGEASARDIYQLIHYIQEVIDRQWGLKLHPEVKMLGEFPSSLV
ncbi:UDP-N-acetylmuramate dehydrogenase [Lyngbya confervoides]|uniref:UDP-N-acetylenolpyruvoylglucosamine reductase n=1 Tax=Lyngbya confervoides BDU141951 TaxID=1574623 RepID=A0ABD4SYG1_9CYAN|nr:UDP-N-acetylmuramate dehydrogenase [Lyngbya confervoides]MCM1981410.1 UDP-N-acetylmuramate dehydrogenase [Lyngbya confervoides BDU141951]